MPGRNLMGQAPVENAVSQITEGVKFSNISYIDASDVYGFQIKMVDTQKRCQLQPFFGVAEYGTEEGALTAAIRARNNLYQANGYPSFLLRRELIAKQKSDASSTGFHGVYFQAIYDYRNPDAGGGVSCHIRSLETGKGSNRSWPLHQFRSQTAAIREAATFRQENILRYNAIVAIFNDKMIKQRAKPAALSELNELQPYLVYQRDIDGDLWRAACRAFRRKKAR